MSKIKFRPDLFEAFNLKQNSEKPIGHLSRLNISGKQFEENLQLQDPMAPMGGPERNSVKDSLVGVITAIRWDGGYADPIVFTCQINAANKTHAAMLMHSGMTDTTCKFKFCIYNHDDATSGYYKSFFCEEIEGLVEKNHGDLEMDIDSTPSEIVTSPRNYELYLSIMPKDDIRQTLSISVSKSATTMDKGWGVPAAG